MRLSAEEQYPYPGVKCLRELGRDVSTVLEAGKANQQIPDDEVLAFATSIDRAVVTQNCKDFIQLHCL
jgi:predicted nuclease of predicted toxin-antitoxin system